MHNCTICFLQFVAQRKITAKNGNIHFFKLKWGEIFIVLIQHCFIRRLSDLTLSEDIGIEPRTVSLHGMALDFLKTDFRFRAYV
jgi:hypothetical protein